MKWAVHTSSPAVHYVDQPGLGGTLKHGLISVAMWHVSVDMVKTYPVSVNTGW